MLRPSAPVVPAVHHVEDPAVGGHRGAAGPAELAVAVAGYAPLLHKLRGAGRMAGRGR